MLKIIQKLWTIFIFSVCFSVICQISNSKHTSLLPVRNQNVVLKQQSHYRFQLGMLGVYLPWIDPSRPAPNKLQRSNECSPSKFRTKQWRNILNQGSKYTALVIPLLPPVCIADITKGPPLPAGLRCSLRILLNTEAATIIQLGLIPKRKHINHM